MKEFKIVFGYTSGLITVNVIDNDGVSFVKIGRCKWNGLRYI